MSVCVCVFKGVVAVQTTPQQTCRALFVESDGWVCECINHSLAHGPPQLSCQPHRCINVLLKHEMMCDGYGRWRQWARMRKQARSQCKHENERTRAHGGCWIFSAGPESIHSCHAAARLAREQVMWPKLASSSGAGTPTCGTCAHARPPGATCAIRSS